MQQWFHEYADRIADGDPVYLACEECGETALPPRTVCAACSSRSLEERSLSETATVTATTKIFSSIPEYADETPYIVVIATFDEGVRLTGQLRGAEGIEPGESVTLGAEQREEDGWLLTFSPTE